MARGSGRAPPREAHPPGEIEPPVRGQLDVRPWNGTRVLEEGVKEHDQVARSLIEDPVQLALMVAPELPKLALDLQAVRKREVRVRGPQGVQSIDLVVENDLSSHVERSIGGSV